MEKSVVFIELRIDACAERIGESRVAVALPHLSRSAEKDCRRKARKIGKRHREIWVEEVMLPGIFRATSEIRFVIFEFFFPRDTVKRVAVAVSLI